MNQIEFDIIKYTTEDRKIFEIETLLFPDEKAANAYCYNEYKSSFGQVNAYHRQVKKVKLYNE